MEYISGRMADNASVGAEMAANTKLASKPGGSCFCNWSVKLSFALLNEPVRSNTFGAKSHKTFTKTNVFFCLSFLERNKVLEVFITLGLNQCILLLTV